jgi:hypothetical protein
MYSIKSTYKSIKNVKDESYIRRRPKDKQIQQHVPSVTGFKPTDARLTSVCKFNIKHLHWRMFQSHKINQSQPTYYCIYIYLMADV